MASISSKETALWKTYLKEEHYDVSLHALRHTVTRRLGLHLDQEVEDTNPNGVLGDWGGLAELIGFDGLEIQGFERMEHKGKEVLQQWKNCENLNPTVGRLIEFLIVMNRPDILTDMHLLIRADVESFLSRREQFSQRDTPIQDETVSSGPGGDEVPRHLTIDEIQLGRQVQYNAFVCYNPEGNSQRDLKFVREMISHLESPHYNLKLFVPYRDDLAGLNAHKITTTIISSRCYHMIVVLSHNFLESESAEFQSAFAFSLSPSARRRRIVPVRLDDCPTPNIMRIMAMCDFTKPDLWDWNWVRLAQSVMRPLAQDDFVLMPPVDSGEGMAEQGPQDTDSAIGTMESMLSATGHRTAPVSMPRPETRNASTAHHTMPVGRLTRDSPVPDARNIRVSPRSSPVSSPRASPRTTMMQRLSDKLKPSKKSKTTQL